MSNDGRIDEAVAEQVYGQFDKLEAKLRATDQLFIDNAKSIMIMNNALASAGSLKQFSDQSNKINKAFQDQKKLANDVAKEEAKLQAQRDRDDKKREAQAAREEQQAARSSKRITEQSRLYTQLSNRLEQLRKDAQDVGAQFGVNSNQFQKASEKVQALDSQLKAIDSTLGKSQRNVGNYPGSFGAFRAGFDGLGNSINQLTREIPAFANSVQTGFMALSNNIPIFYDEVRRASAEIKALRAQGKEVPGLFSQMLRSVLSFGTVLSIGITLLTIYGKEIGEFFSSMFKGTEALSAFAERQKAVNKAFENTDYTGAIKNINELTINIGLAKQGLISKDGVLKQYNETIGKTVGQAGSLNEAEQLLVKNGDAFIKITFLKAAAQLALEEASAKALEAEKARQKSGLVEMEGGGTTRDLSNLTIWERLKDAFAQNQGVTDSLVDAATSRNVKAAEKGAETLLEIATKFQEEAAKISLKNGFSFFGDDDKNTSNMLRDALELNRAILEATKERSEAVYTDESKSLEVRLAALDKYTKASIGLVKNESRLQLTETGLTADKRKAIEVRANSDILNINTENRNKAADIRKQDNERVLRELEDQFNQQLAAAKKADQNLLDQMAAASEQRQLLLSESADSELVALAEQFAAGAINAKEYAKQRLEIQKKLVIDVVNEEIRGVQTIIALQKAAGHDTGDQEKKLAELKQRLSKETTAIQINSLEELASKEKELNDKRWELGFELANFGSQIAEASFARSKERLTQESEAIDIRKEKEIEAVERSLGSEEEKAARISIINAKAQAQKEAIERRQRQLDIERAKFERARNIANIIGQTARAVVESLPNIPLAILVGAIGAVQLATAVAAPIAKYEVGTNYSNEEWAWVGEKGPELMIDPSGKMSFTPDKPTMTYLQEGTKIINNQTLQRMMVHEQLSGISGGRSVGLDASSGLLRKLIDKTDDLKTVFKEQKHQSTVITEGGIRWMHRSAKNWNDYKGRNIK